MKLQGPLMRQHSQGYPGLQIKSESVGDSLVVHLSGHIDELGADALSAVLDSTLEQRTYCIVFNLSDVLFLGSTGLGQIMRAYRVAGKEGGYVRIAAPQPLVADVFRLTKLDRLLPIYPSVEAALKGDR